VATNSAPALGELTERFPVDQFQHTHGDRKPTSPQTVAFNRREICRASPAVRARPHLAAVDMLALPCSAANGNDAA
jgi:hypothetical protein